MEYEYKISLADTALDDLKEIYEYISQILKESQIAKRLIKRIIQGMIILKTSPYGCRKIHIKRDTSPYRRLVIGNYIVLYVINEFQEEVLIVHIFYGKRDYLVIDD